MHWDQNQIELAETMWREGATATAIAVELRGGFTRNAVLGLIHRRGLSGRIKKNLSTSTPRQPRKKREPRGATDRPHTIPIFKAEPLPEPTVMIEISVEQRKTLLQLNSKTCRWPIGNPGSGDFYFCGAVPREDAPYCSDHCRIAYMPRVRREGTGRPFLDFHKR